MPVEETDTMIRVRVRDPKNFDKKSFRVIDIDEKQGIKSVIGKLKSTGKWANQNFMFFKDKGWTVEKSLAWVKDHGFTAKLMSKSEVEEMLQDIEEFTKSGEQQKSQVAISKVNAKRRIVYGIVYSPDDPDAHNHFMNADEIERMAHRYMLASRKMDERHDFIDGAGGIIESFIAREGDPDFPKGSWVIGVKVNEDAVWEKIQAGKINAFSMAGTAELGAQKEMDSRWYDDKGNRKTNPAPRS